MKISKFSHVRRQKMFRVAEKRKKDSSYSLPCYRKWKPIEVRKFKMTSASVCLSAFTGCKGRLGEMMGVQEMHLSFVLA